MHYNASIGKSFYKVPYGKQEDLPPLIEVCKKINSVVNLILATDKSITNEQALLLALVNICYEQIENVAHGDFKYTDSDVLGIIKFLNTKLLTITQ